MGLEVIWSHYLSMFVVASTLSEANVSAKTGAPARPGVNPGNHPLERVRANLRKYFDKAA